MSSFEHSSPEAVEPLAPPLDMAAAAGVATGRAAQIAPLAVKLDIITQRARFDALEREWNALHERVGAPHQVFQTFNWCWHWANHYLANGRSARGPRLAIVTGRVAGRLAMIWPLQIERAMGVRVVSWLGEPVSQYGDVLVEPGPHREELLAAGREFLARRLKPDVAVLAKVREDAVAAQHLAAHGARVLAEQVAPCNDLTRFATYADFDAGQPSKVRKSRRRHRRRLAEKGAVSAAVYGAGPAARALAVEAIRMKRAWLAERGLTSRAFADRRLEAFFSDIAGDRARPVGCRLGVLRCVGAPIAIELAFHCRGHVASHVKAYDPAFELHSPGNLLTEEMIADLYGAGAATYDLLAPDAAYKREWASTAVRVTDYAVPLTRRGVLWTRLYLKTVRHGLKSTLLRLPTGVRRSLYKLCSYVGPLAGGTAM